MEQANPGKYNIAPRIAYDMYEGFQEVVNATGYGTFSKMFYIDTVQEAKIGLGESYSVPPLKANECVVFSGISDQLLLKVGDKISLMQSSLFNTMISAALAYNDFAKANNKQQFGQNDRLRNDIVNVPCTVAAIMSTP